MMRLIAGVDEAGRGPLAGPVVAAAVILGDVPIIGLDDSKKLPEKRRAALEQLILRTSITGIGIATVAEIDATNILQATLLAMTRAVAALRVKPDHILVDGNCVPEWACSCEAIIGGDALYPCISAASIIAKQARDRIMIAADEDCPGYGWAQNKGYGVAAHNAAIKRLGLTKHHRRLFVRRIIAG